jgi:hypothetical protein
MPLPRIRLTKNSRISRPQRILEIQGCVYYLQGLYLVAVVGYPNPNQDTYVKSVRSKEMNYPVDEAYHHGLHYYLNSKTLEKLSMTRLSSSHPGIHHFYAETADAYLFERPKHTPKNRLPGPALKHRL